MSTETGGPSPEEMGIQSERNMFDITENPDGTFTATLPAATLENDPNLVVPKDETFASREEAEQAVAKAREDLEK